MLRNTMESCLITFLKNTEAATGDAEAETRGVLEKRCSLKISQTSLESTFVGVFFNKVPVAC